MEPGTWLRASHALFHLRLRMMLWSRNCYQSHLIGTEEILRLREIRQQAQGQGWSAQMDFRRPGFLLVFPGVHRVSWWKPYICCSFPGVTARRHKSAFSNTWGIRSCWTETFSWQMATWMRETIGFWPELGLANLRQVSGRGLRRNFHCPRGTHSQILPQLCLERAFTF